MAKKKSSQSKNTLIIGAIVAVVVLAFLYMLTSRVQEPTQVTDSDAKSIDFTPPSQEDIEYAQEVIFPSEESMNQAINR